MRLINKSRISKSIIRTYMELAAFIGYLAFVFIYLAFLTSAGLVMLRASFIVLVLIEHLFLMLIRSLRNTRYTLLDNKIIIDTSVLIGGSKKILLGTIESVEKTLYPFVLRLFGASFHGGYFSIPGLGRAFISITNLDDVILIKTTKNNYFISPRNPMEFLDVLKLKIAHQKN